MESYYRARILIVEDDTISAAVISGAISDFYAVDIVSDGLKAIEYCANKLPDLILMDIEMPSMDGLTACKLLQHQDSTQHIPVIFITGHTELISEDLSWEAGCADFITKPFSIIALRHRINHHLEVKLLTDKLKKMARIDGLTGVQNRHGFDVYLAEQIKLSQRTKRPLGLIMVDVDFFKQFNDSYGHIGGDECLQQLAKTMTKILVRPSDHIARYGGEEFAVLLPDTSFEGVRHVAEKLVQTVRNLKIQHEDSPTGILTVSVGGTSFCSSDLGEKDFIQRADLLLYKAKNSGRNLAVVSQ
jgi:diguanylate cyclase (GGDEF)-like protein